MGTLEGKDKPLVRIPDGMIGTWATGICGKPCFFTNVGTLTGNASCPTVSS
jgi:hypothetical protein